jgi:hypothetical protein
VHGISLAAHDSLPLSPIQAQPSMLTSKCRATGRHDSTEKRQREALFYRLPLCPFLCRECRTAKAVSAPVSCLRDMLSVLSVRLVIRTEGMVSVSSWTSKGRPRIPIVCVMEGYKTMPASQERKLQERPDQEDGIK